MNRINRIIIPVLLGLFLGGLYLCTLAPGLSWAYDGADGGDLVTAAATGGIPHPTGYPTYLLIASAFLKIPFGSLAYRTNLMSSVCTVIAALMIYKIVRSMHQSILFAFIASLVFGTFQLVWSQAIITEVNALNALFVTLLIYFFIAGGSHRWMGLIGGIVAGLGIGNHLSTIFILPLMFVDKTHPGNLPLNKELRKKPFSSYIKLIAHRLIGLCFGLSIYLLIPIRARAQAPVNWGNAVNWNGLIWLVSGKMYWGRLINFNGSYLLAGIQAWSHFLIQQLGIIGLLLIFIVLGVLFKPSRLYITTGWLVLVYSAFSILYYSPDSYVYLIPALISLSIWIGLGSKWITEKVSQRFPFLKPVMIIAISAFFILRPILAIPVMSLSADRDVEQYAQTILNLAPAQAILFSEGDEATFSLWYFHYVYHLRPDIAVISRDLLVQPWYSTVLRHNYPDLVIPDDPQEPDIILDNPQRPICRLAPDLQASIECSP
jgi:hypothetical protein